MATKTFMKLNIEKKNRIFEAILDELYKEKYSKVSINKIITAAKIPRGSFYQYFESLDDAAMTTIVHFKKENDLSFNNLEFPEDPLDALIFMTEAWLKSVKNDPRIFRIWFNLTRSEYKPYMLEEHEEEISNRDDMLADAFSKHPKYKRYTEITVSFYEALNSCIDNTEYQPVVSIERHLKRLNLLKELINKGEK